MLEGRLPVKRAAIARGGARSGPHPRTPSRLPAASAAILVLLGCIAGCRTAPIQDVVDAPLPPAWGGASVDEMDEAVWRAGRKVGWEIERLRPGVLRGTWRYKHHVAMVTITHAGRLLSIRYEESDHLLHEGNEIHHNYNRVVQQLLRQIQQEPVTAQP